MSGRFPSVSSQSGHRENRQRQGFCSRRFFAFGRDLDIWNLDRAEAGGRDVKVAQTRDYPVSTRHDLLSEVYYMTHLVWAMVNAPCLIDSFGNVQPSLDRWEIRDSISFNFNNLLSFWHISLGFRMNDQDYLKNLVLSGAFSFYWTLIRPGVSYQWVSRPWTMECAACNAMNVGIDIQFYG